MKTFNNMKIKAKLLTGFIIMAVIVGVVGAVGITNIKALYQSDTDLYEHMTVPIAQMGQISTAFQRMRVNTRDMIIANDPVTIKENSDKIAERQAELDTLSAEFESRIVSDEMRTAFNEFAEARNNYKGSLTELTALANQNQDAQAFALMAETGAAGIAARAEQDAIAKMVDLKLADGSAKSTANTVQANSVVTTMIIVVLIGVLMSIGLGFFLGSTISKPIIKAAAMLKEMSMGHLGMRLKMDSKDEVGEMAMCMDSFADDLQNVVIGTMKQISSGDVSANIEIRDEQDEIAPALKETIETIRALIVEANMLSQAAVAGQLDTRGNADAFNGGYKEIVEGVNNTLDAVVGPLNVAAEYVERISKGDIPPKITDSYNGDFNEIKNNLNTCIDAVTALVDDAAMLSLAGIEGRLDTRADASKHGGDFAKIVEGVNNTLDAVIGPLNVAAEYVDRISKGDIPPKITDSYNGDFNEIKNNLNTCIDAINALVDDAAMLSLAGIEGRLDTRADASKHGGDFAKIVEGVNSTLDAVIGPLNVAAEYVDRISKGDIPPKITDSYNGDFNEIKNNLNTCIDAITALVDDAAHLAQAGIAGQLDTRADASKHQGDFAKIVEDMNRTDDSLKRYVKEITSTLEEMGRGNLDQEIKSDYPGDFLNIKIAFNDITSQLSATMADIDEAAGQVEAGARQISDGGQALSQGTTEQASSIEQINASISEIAEETKKNAIHANEANELAVEVRTNAEVGNGQMDAMVSAMIEINESSQNISKIIKVIDDIAFQTNILALNAAVEAARAGQHGKGFAVVAEEVRTLAARSAEAAKETTGLIEGSINKVEIGTKIADQTAISLKEILSEIERVADLVGNIAQASNEQASEIAQITQAIDQVSQVVQTNSATAEESAAASEKLSSQSEILMEMVGAFKLKAKSERNKNKPDGSSIKRAVVNVPEEPRIILNDIEYGEIKVDTVRIDKY